MKKLKLISEIWGIRHKATLASYLIAFVSLEEEVFVLMKRKDTYNAVKTLVGGYYIRESNTEAFNRLRAYYLWDVKLTSEQIKNFKKIESREIEFSDEDYNGWKVVQPAVYHPQQQIVIPNEQYLTS